MAEWRDLPAELRWQIYAHVLKVSSWKACSALRLVNREWNWEFSYNAPCALGLDQDDLDLFEKVMSQADSKTRRSLVRSIRLCIKLPEYDCRKCRKVEYAAESKANDILFLNTLQRFMAFMSTWTDEDIDSPTNRKRIAKGFSPLGISLEIDIWSPSDGKHAVRDFRLSEEYVIGAPLEEYQRHKQRLLEEPATARGEDEGKHKGEDGEGKAKAKRVAGDECPAWVRACAGNPPHKASRNRLLSVIGDPRRLHFDQVFRDPASSGGNSGEARDMVAFPPVRVLDRLSITRRSYRQISPKLLGRFLGTGLPRLHSLDYEVWPLVDKRDRTRFGQDLGRQVIEGLPAHVRKICLFSEFDDRLHPYNSSAKLLASVDLGRSLAHFASFSQLRTLIAPFAIEATDFFSHMSNFPLTHGISLESIVLTSRHLHPTKRRADRLPRLGNRLFSKAGQVVFTRMPYLRHMLIFNTTKAGNTFLFQFDDRTAPGGGGKALLKWGSTWHTDEGSPRFTTWSTLYPLVRPGKNLEIVQQGTDWMTKRAPRIKVLDSTGLRFLYLRPESRNQIRREHGLV